jgi:hypothetical protein
MITRYQTWLTTFLTITLLWSGCVLSLDDLLPDPPPEELPALTAEGLNTFGCLVNGNVWLPKTEGFFKTGLNEKLECHYNEEGRILSLVAQREIDSENNMDSVHQYIYFHLYLSETNQVDSIHEIGVRDRERERCENQGLEPLQLDTAHPWEFNIEYMDTSRHIIAGTFFFVATLGECSDTVVIEDGRFDVFYP